MAFTVHSTLLFYFILAFTHSMFGVFTQWNGGQNTWQPYYQNQGGYDGQVNYYQQGQTPSSWNNNQEYNDYSSYGANGNPLFNGNNYEATQPQLEPSHFPNQYPNGRSPNGYPTSNGQDVNHNNYFQNQVPNGFGFNGNQINYNQEDNADYWNQGFHSSFNGNPRFNPQGTNHVRRNPTQLSLPSNERISKPPRRFTSLQQGQTGTSSLNPGSYPSLPPSGILPPRHNSPSPPRRRPISSHPSMNNAEYNDEEEEEDNPDRFITQTIASNDDGLYYQDCDTGAWVKKVQEIQLSLLQVEKIFDTYAEVLKLRVIKYDEKKGILLYPYLFKALYLLVKATRDFNEFRTEFQLLCKAALDTKGEENTYGLQYMLMWLHWTNQEHQRLTKKPWLPFFLPIVQEKFKHYAVLFEHYEEYLLRMASAFEGYDKFEAAVRHTSQVSYDLQSSLKGSEWRQRIEEDAVLIRPYLPKVVCIASLMSKVLGPNDGEHLHDGGLLRDTFVYFNTSVHTVLKTSQYTYSDSSFRDLQHNLENIVDTWEYPMPITNKVQC